MTFKNTFGWGQSLVVAKYGAAGVLLASTGVVLLSGPIASDPAPSKLECPKIEASNDPFDEFDDVMTEDEKREALHDDLKQKLASHKALCDPLTKTPKAPSATAKQPTKEAGSPGGKQGSGQGSSEGSEGSAGEKPESQDSPSKEGSPTQKTPAGGGPEQGAAGNGVVYSSPWEAQEPSEESGVIPLEPRAPTDKAPTPTHQPVSGEQLNSEPELGVSGAGPIPNSTDATKPQEQTSKFLEKYGGAGQLPRENIEDIANRHKNAGGRTGSPGNTGTLQKNQKSGAPGGAPRNTQTISANDAAIKALEERFKRETNPEKKKQIQAEIDRLKK